LYIAKAIGDCYCKGIAKIFIIRACHYFRLGSLEKTFFMQKSIIFSSQIKLIKDDKQGIIILYNSKQGQRQFRPSG